MSDFSLLEKAIRKKNLLHQVKQLRALVDREFPKPTGNEYPECLKSRIEKAQLLALYDEQLAKQVCPWVLGMPCDSILRGIHQPYHSLGRTFAFAREWHRRTAAVKKCWESILKDVRSTNQELCEELRALAKNWERIEELCNHLSLEENSAASNSAASPFAAKPAASSLDAA